MYSVGAAACSVILVKSWLWNVGGTRLINHSMWGWDCMCWHRESHICAMGGSLWITRAVNCLTTENPVGIYIGMWPHSGATTAEDVSACLCSCSEQSDHVEIPSMC